MCAGSLLDEERRCAEPVVRGIALRYVLQVGKLDETDDCLACCVALLALCELRCLPVGIEIVELDDLFLQVNCKHVGEGRIAMTRRPRPNRLSQDGRALALTRALALVGDLRVSVGEVVVRNLKDAAKRFEQTCLSGGDGGGGGR